MKALNRREFLKLTSVLAGSVVVSSAVSGCRTMVHPSEVSFTHGVASGDPSNSSVIIWSRAVPAGQASTNTLDVNWEVASDREFNNMIRTGSASTSRARDFTIKIDVQDLEPNTTYYYRFLGKNNISTVGKTKTLPVGNVQAVKLAVFSCSNYPAGYFTPYSLAAQMQDIDVVVHLGDYIYEYAADGYATEKAEQIGRSPDKNNLTEVISLADYRHRYALYRTDEGLQAIHASAPFIAVWDDHEITNDTYKEGAQNHNEGEGDFFARRASAVQAYYEWLPIRPPFGETSAQIYRSFDFGNLLSLHMLDTRLIGRDKQLAYADYMDQEGKMDTQSFMQDLQSEQRTLLGQHQFDWLSQKVQASSAVWQILGQQVLMGKMTFPAEVLANQDRTKAAQIIHALATIKRRADQGLPISEQEKARIQQVMAYNLDAWDGYPAEREKLYAMLTSHNKRLAVIAGDTHNAWCNQLVDSDGKAVGYEYATPGVSSPGMESYLSLSTEQAKQMADDLSVVIEDVQYCNLHQRGFLTLTILASQIEAKWHFVDTVDTPQGRIANTFTMSHTPVNKG
ncbi:alkaline phosphatase D family protein [Glaciecola sp. XM2]|uniref:alkaline phosphatase D family protein n=1 Tax=Glaciecola sp. XM2 TaxID=1914931 RepID=UPI001BDF51AF|nr:alkaline phosphatase D family protein [Glaciecola sp. XM2]MBT1450207.1 alkaline phosphatase D family protein [Glaciecola sp. XM2]